MSAVTDVGHPFCVKTYTIEYDKPIPFVVYKFLCLLPELIEGLLVYFSSKYVQRRKEEAIEVVIYLMIPCADSVEEA